MITCGHWLLGPMSQVGIVAGCTNSTDDIKRWENEDFFKKSSKWVTTFLMQCLPNKHIILK